MGRDCALSGLRKYDLHPDFTTCMFTVILQHVRLPSFYNMYVYRHFIESLKCYISYTIHLFNFTLMFICDSCGRKEKPLA